MPLPMSNAQPPVCTTDPGAWDLDQASPDQAVAAVAECGRCPLLESCRAALRAEPTTPKSVIWGGFAFGDKGQTMVLSVDGGRPKAEIPRSRKAAARPAAAA